MDLLIQEPCGNTVEFIENFGDEDSVLNLGLAIQAVDVDIMFDAISDPMALLTVERQTCTIHPAI